MKRRNFINASLAATALPLSFAAAQNSSTDMSNKEKELYELRSYAVRFNGNLKLLMSYLTDALQPALERVGVNHFMIFNELGNADPKKVWVLISYPSAEIYLKAQNLQGDNTYVAAAANYNAVPVNTPIYNRFQSFLLHAFDGMPQMSTPKEGAGLFELRIYEGYSEDAVRRKIKMFNKEEFPLFYEVGLIPIFFGDMIAGPLRPCLVYMLNFKDMEERNTNWGKFLQHPDWNTMKAKPEYLNTVSNIIKTFLVPA